MAYIKEKEMNINIMISRQSNFVKFFSRKKKNQKGTVVEVR